MNEFQKKVLDYLTVDGHPERTKALTYILDAPPDTHRVLSVFADEKMARDRLARFLKDNPLGFCADGIKRARRELLGEVDNPKRRVRITFEVDVEKLDGKDFAVTEGNGNFIYLSDAFKDGTLSKPTGKARYSNYEMVYWHEVKRY